MKRHTVCLAKDRSVREGETFRCTGNHHTDETCGHLHLAAWTAMRCFRRTWRCPTAVAKVEVVGTDVLGVVVVRVLDVLAEPD